VSAALPCQAPHVYPNLAVSHRSYSWCGDGCKYEGGTASPFGASEELDDGDEGGPASLWSSGDVIGCGYNSITSEIFYTRNGYFVGTCLILFQAMGLITTKVWLMGEFHQIFIQSWPCQARERRST